MARLLLAVGNRLMQDDGVALHVLAYLQEWLESKGLSCIAAETDAYFALSLLQDGDQVIVMDASVLGNPPGTVTVCPLEQACKKAGSRYSQHELSVFSLLRLYSICISGYFIGIEAAELGYGDSLSAALAVRFCAITAKVKSIISVILEEWQNA